MRRLPAPPGPARAPEIAPPPPPAAAPPPARPAATWADVLAIFLGRRRPMPLPPLRAPVAPSPERTIAADEVREDSSLDLGVRDIRRTDRGFDPRRFVGYAGMVFRAAHRAWTARDIASLRDRVTPHMYAELQARCDRLRHMGHASRVEQPEITVEVTEAWQESGRDYLTAYIAGSMVDYTIDEATGRLVAGSRTTPREVEEFWTFTRPSGLNFWMLSAIQTA
ncbi:MAG: Tim44 domain-containing protein [Candidatus Rokubacteria bacterium]|nr:Tim44 domain-containing protein [Candidatus Rokubacteria bacterium]